MNSMNNKDIYLNNDYNFKNNINLNEINLNYINSNNINLNDFLNNNVVVIYLSLINNIQKSIYGNIQYLNEIEWNFHLKNLKFLKKIIKFGDLKEKYKIFLIIDINKHIKYMLCE